MTLHVALTHRTSYRYDRPVALGPQTVRLRPAPHARTPIVSYTLLVEPRPHFLNWQQDPQGNYLARVVFPERVTHFQVTVDLVADMATINPFDFFLEPQAETWPFAYDPQLEHELAPFRRQDQPGTLLADLLATVPRGEQHTITMLVALNRAIRDRVAYIVRLEPGVLTPEETLATGQGSCRDSAWLLVNLLRHLGFAARFVSGYLIQLVGDVKPLTGPEGPKTDFTDLHAWAEVYLPGAGWIGLDATSGLLTGEGHIPLACSPDPTSAAPISGAVDPCEVAFDVAMSLRRVAETPRTTKPYPDAVWAEIRAAGHRVDSALRAGDVRLTFGGEPTFVAAADQEGGEWNADALGPSKRNYAGKLIRRLNQLWAPGAALQYAMGKHYPGEQLPRWALHSFWRADHEPVWRDPALFAADEDQGDATQEDAAQFARALAQRLQLDPAYVTPAYEDIHYYLWRENRLPANVLLEANKLDDKLERERLVRVFAHGLGRPVGSVLPLRRAGRNGQARWQSGTWLMRGDALFLVPGDSPVGFRLPLKSLPWADPDHVEHDFEPDPLTPRGKFPTRAAIQARHSILAEGPPRPGFPHPGIPHRAHDQSGVVPGREEPEVVRTALTVEARNGIIHVLVPPLYAAEDWLDLVAAIEATAAETGRKLFLEGYPPPADPRLRSFSVTPDPGVIEVNVAPTETWDDQIEKTEQLYQAAREVGLAAEKFMLDGRHVGTGGGNHVVMGAHDAQDSPFLRRPDLLKSLLGFWHNHPSLSYLFSGLFIGPMSQHPRIDEAREDAVRELEIAFAQIAPHASGNPQIPFWLTDRVFRNILCDMTGNTHRTEFCIDKMYAPENSGGRRGLVEFRAFEMPPHPRMAAAQMLLMRAAIAAFWSRPYERRLIRFGTDLHDRFMLPHYVQQDFADALEDLAQFGFRLKPEWFAPHMAFRFPTIGAVALRGMELTVNHALEPWHVLGEEPVAGGTVRYVDSSLERVQARVTGWTPDRYVLACNGAAVPLRQTERQGEYVGGIRFKAWQPPGSLHPTIPAHTPLIFDLYDRWSGRSLGGLTHHVSHPGGRHYETFPVNASEAEARRRARFFPIGHTPGPMPEPVEALSLEHPFTLDLRELGKPGAFGKPGKSGELG
jgi:uncharacterized protein (DUF2126 family)/transglutaminase-like putative cysteine protease